MKFEIMNPSDKAFIESNSFETACVATCILGRGWYGLKEVDGENHMPTFVFGGVDKFFTEKFNKSFDEACEGADKTAIADAFNSVSLAGERTSLNDIARKAKALAEHFRGAS